MTQWLTKELRSKIKKEFEPRYKKKLSEIEVETIAENLTGYMEVILKFKYRQMKKLQKQPDILSNMKTLLVDAVDAFVVEKEEKFVVFQEMYDLLETFPNRKILLTGANDEQYKMFGLDKMPYEVFTLKHNPEKTDPQYFKTLLEKYDLKADDVIYFEHNPDAVKSAQSVGIPTFYYDSEKQDLDALREFLTTHL